MEGYLAFLLQHGELALATAGVLALIIFYELREHAREITHLSPQKAVEIVNRQKGVFIDIREANLFKEGHVLNAISLPLSELERHPAKIDKYKAQPIILIGQLGNQSARALKLLAKHGCESVYTLKGGMGAWQLAGFPIKRD